MTDELDRLRAENAQLRGEVDALQAGLAQTVRVLELVNAYVPHEIRALLVTDSVTDEDKSN